MKDFNKDETIEDLIKTSLDRVKTLMETNTIVGDAIVTPFGKTIIPISKVSVGFVVGGGEYSNNKVKNHMPMAGGSGCGMSVSPVGFIIMENDGVKFVDVENKTAYQTILNLVNKLINKLGKDKNGEQNEDKN